MAQARQADEAFKGRLAELECALRDSEAKVAGRGRGAGGGGRGAR